MDMHYAITDQDYYVLKATANWAESQGSQGTANVLRDIIDRAKKIEDDPVFKKWNPTMKE